MGKDEEEVERQSVALQEFPNAASIPSNQHF
jgi:hypothetical protein